MYRPNLQFLGETLKDGDFASSKYALVHPDSRVLMPEMFYPGRKPAGPVAANRTSPQLRDCEMFWPINERSGSELHDLVNQHTGTITGAVWQGNGLEFSNDQVLGPTFDVENWSGLTIEIIATFNNPTEAGEHTLACQHSAGAGERIFIFQIEGGTGNLIIGMNNWANFIVASGAVAQGIDQHVVAVWDLGNELRAYVQGEKTGSNTAGNAFDSGSPAFTLGVRGDGAEYHNGSIKLVRVYDRALTDTEVRLNYLHPYGSGPNPLLIPA